MFKILESLRRSPTYIASGQRVLLRQLGRQDLRRVRAWFEDLDLLSYAFGVQGDESTLRGLADTYYKDIFWWQKNMLAIDTVDGHCIGFLKYSVREDHEKHAKVGIVIGDPRYRSGGCGTEAMRLLLGYLFASHMVDRVELDTASFNLRAQRSFTKCGFVPLGAFTELCYSDGKSIEKIWMSIRRADFVPLEGAHLKDEVGDSPVQPSAP